MTDAVTIAVAWGSALSTVWGYYITVLVGLAGAIGALAATGQVINLKIKSVITAVALIFTIVNAHSLNSVINNLNRVIDYISSHNGALGWIAGQMRFGCSMITFQPIGMLLVLLWLWIGIPGPPGEWTRLKNACVDNPLLRTGSANFSRSGETPRTTTWWRSEEDLSA